METLHLKKTTIRNMILMARECFDISYEPSHITALVKTIGIRNTLLFPDLLSEEYLIEHGVHLTVSEDSASNVIIVEDE